MIKVTFLYPNNPGGHFNADHYIHVHIPMAINLLGTALKGATAEIGISSAMPTDLPPYAAIAKFTFESVQAFGEAVMPHYQKLQGDIPNYTDIEPIIQISDLRISQ
jgi:uncharacterized protein (TIGR02118 family)